MTTAEIHELARVLAPLVAQEMLQASRPPLTTTPADHAIQLARSGKIEESKAFLKSLSKRRSA